MSHTVFHCLPLSLPSFLRTPHSLPPCLSICTVECQGLSQPACQMSTSFQTMLPTVPPPEDQSRKPQSPSASSTLSCTWWTVSAETEIICFRQHPNTSSSSGSHVNTSAAMWLCVAQVCSYPCSLQSPLPGKNRSSIPRLQSSLGAFPKFSSHNGALVMSPPPRGSDLVQDPRAYAAPDVV